MILSTLVLRNYILKCVQDFMDTLYLVGHCPRMPHVARGLRTAVADSDQSFGGSHMGRQQVFTCLNTPDFLWHSLGITQKWLPFVGQESGYFS